MNLFKSAFFRDEASEEHKKPEEVEIEGAKKVKDSAEGSPGVSEREERSSSEGLWSLGGLVKTLQSKSEEVIEIYRRDLEDFRIGFRRETEAIREFASRAVKDLPDSLQIRAAVAQESLQSVGEAIDEFGNTVWKGTDGSIAEGKHLISNLDDNLEKENVTFESGSSRTDSSCFHKYSRLDAQIRALQMDSNSYRQEPEDRRDFEAWLSGFNIGEKEEEIENLCRGNRFVDEVRQKLVPSSVDYETFWSRYFYRVHKLGQAEEARISLVKKAIIAQEAEDDLTWEFDDDEDEDKNADLGMIQKGKREEHASVKVGDESDFGSSHSSVMKSSENTVKEAAEETEFKSLNKGKEVVVEGSPREKPADSVERGKKNDNKGSKDEIKGVLLKPGANLADSDKSLSTDKQVRVEKEKLDDESGTTSSLLEAEMDPAESSNSSDFSVVSSKPSSGEEEDDLEWDEIEALDEVDDRKFPANSQSPPRADIRKKLHTCLEQQGEDLSWEVDD